MKKIITAQLLVMVMSVAMCYGGDEQKLSEDADRDAIAAKIAQAEAAALAEVQADAVAEKIAEVERVVAVEMANEAISVAEMTSVGDSMSFS